MAFFRKAIEKLTAGLAKTREKFLGGLKSFLAGRQLDEELLDELEAKLIGADMGVATAAQIRAEYEVYKKVVDSAGLKLE